MPDHDDLIQRLHDLGSEPVPPATASEHLTALATEPASVRPTLAQKLRVGAAFAAGLLIGGTGLAAAGALPDQAQQAAHEALARVNVNVPPGLARAAEARGQGGGPDGEAGVARAVAPEDCPDWDFAGGPPRNHGQYVSTMAKRLRGMPDAEREAAMERYADSRCGKPAHAGTGEDDQSKTEAEQQKEAEEQAEAQEEAERGRPADAGRPERAGPPAGAGSDDDTGVTAGDDERAGPSTPETEPAPAD